MAFFANKGMAAQSIQTYLSALWNTQISMGYPDPQDCSSLPVLKRVQAGIRRAQANKATCQKRIRLPITIGMLKAIQTRLNATREQDKELAWAISTLAFFGFFRLGELLLDKEANYNWLTHLSWGNIATGNIATDSRENPSILRVHLRWSKCNQGGGGVDIFVGRTKNELCLVATVLSYLVVCGSSQGPLFINTQQQSNR